MEAGSHLHIGLKVSVGALSFNLGCNPDLMCDLGQVTSYLSFLISNVDNI